MSKTLQLSAVRKSLSTLHLSTKHAEIVKSNTIAHLMTYEQSLKKCVGVDLPALEAAINGLAWLCMHVQIIDDKRLYPSERIMLAQAYLACQALHSIHITTGATP